MNTNIEQKVALEAEIKALENRIAGAEKMVENYKNLMASDQADIFKGKNDQEAQKKHQEGFSKYKKIVEEGNQQLGFKKIALMGLSSRIEAEKQKAEVKMKVDQKLAEEARLGELYYWANYYRRMNGDTEYGKGMAL